MRKPAVALCGAGCGDWRMAKESNPQPFGVVAGFKPGCRPHGETILRVERGQCVNPATAFTEPLPPEGASRQSLVRLYSPRPRSGGNLFSRWLARETLPPPTSRSPPKSGIERA